MLQKLPISKFEWIEDTSKFVEDFIKSYNEESNKGYFLEVDVQHPEKLQRKNENQKIEKLVTYLNDKIEYFIHIRNLKAIIHGLVFQKVVRAIKSNQNTCLKPYIDMNTRLLKKAKSNFEKKFL